MSHNFVLFDKSPDNPHIGILTLNRAVRTLKA